MEATALAPTIRAPRVLERLRSDAALVERFRLGDDAAFATLYRRHRKRVYLVCLGVLGSQEDAKDAEQDVWTAAASSLRTATPEVLPARLARIARNVSVDIVRRRRETVHDLPDRAGGADAHAVVEQRDAVRDVLVALRELPERQRVALVLRELGGCSYPEIALAVGVDEEAVGGLIARARISLHERRTQSSCESVRAHLAAELDGRRRPAEVRRHLRACDGCRELREGVLRDRRDLRALAPTTGALKLLAVIGGALAKGAAVSEGPKLAVLCAAALCAGAGVQQLEASHEAHRSSTRSGSGDATARAWTPAAAPAATPAVPTSSTTSAEPSTGSTTTTSDEDTDEPAAEEQPATVTEQPAPSPERRTTDEGDRPDPDAPRRGGDRMRTPSMPEEQGGAGEQRGPGGQGRGEQRRMGGVGAENGSPKAVEPASAPEQAPADPAPPAEPFPAEIETPE